MPHIGGAACCYAVSILFLSCRSWRFVSVAERHRIHWSWDSQRRSAGRIWHDSDRRRADGRRCQYLHEHRHDPELRIHSSGRLRNGRSGRRRYPGLHRPVRAVSADLASTSCTRPRGRGRTQRDGQGRSPGGADGKSLLSNLPHLAASTRSLRRCLTPTATSRSWRLTATTPGTRAALAGCTQSRSPAWAGWCRSTGPHRHRTGSTMLAVRRPIPDCTPATRAGTKLAPLVTRWLPSVAVPTPTTPARRRWHRRRQLDDASVGPLSDRLPADYSDSDDAGSLSDRLGGLPSPSSSRGQESYRREAGHGR